MRDTEKFYKTVGRLGAQAEMILESLNCIKPENDYVQDDVLGRLDRIKDHGKTIIELATVIQIERDRFNKQK